MNKEGILYTLLFVFVVSFAFVLLLAMTNLATIERVQLNEELAQRVAVLSAMGVDVDGAEEIQARFASVAADENDGLYVSTIDGTTVYALDFSGPGLWGTIRGVLGVTADLRRIVGIEIVSDSETPGLGARINEEWFKSQFRGEEVGGGRITVKTLPGDGDPDKSNSTVDAITGATRTSDSIQAIVNEVMERVAQPETMNRLQELANEGGNS